MPKPLNKDYSELSKRAKLVLKDNFTGEYSRPAAGIYPDQVLWDSCFIAIGKSHYDLSEAQLELISLLRGQWKNGMIPNIILNNRPRFSFERWGWKSELSQNAPKLPTSGITQPPILAEAVKIVGEKMKSEARREWYLKMYPNLVSYHEWIYRERDPDSSGLVLQIHPWETGLDTTPPWISEIHKHNMPIILKLLEFTKLEKLGNYFRYDNKFVSFSERTSNIDALVLQMLRRNLRKQAYDIDKILNGQGTFMYDVTFNSILIRSNDALEYISKSIGEKLPSKLTEAVIRSRTAIDKLWDPSDEQYYSLNHQTKRLVKLSTIATFMPLYAGTISKERAAKLVRLLNDESAYATPFPVPSVPINSLWFKPRNYWQGPTWINTNWFIINGLEKYEFYDEADRLRKISLELVDKSGFYEYFNPISGEHAGAKDFSWTASLVIDLLSKY